MKSKRLFSGCKHLLFLMTHQAGELLNLILGNINKNNNSNVDLCIIFQVSYFNSDLRFIYYFYLASGSHCLSSCSIFSRGRCPGGQRRKQQKTVVGMPSAPWPHLTMCKPYSKDRGTPPLLCPAASFPSGWRARVRCP